MGVPAQLLKIASIKKNVGLHNDPRDLVRIFTRTKKSWWHVTTDLHVHYLYTYFICAFVLNVWQVSDWTTRSISCDLTASFFEYLSRTITVAERDWPTIKFLRNRIRIQDPWLNFYFIFLLVNIGCSVRIRINWHLIEAKKNIWCAMTSGFFWRVSTG